MQSVSGSDSQTPISFGIGQTAGVEEYILSRMEAMACRLGLSGAQCTHLQTLFLEALRANVPLMKDNLAKGFVPLVRQSRTLWDHVASVAVGSDSRLIGREHVATALTHAREGGTVLVIQNHTSGADTLLWDALVQRAFGAGITEEWGYMAGHVVNLYLIPLLLTAALQRFQIFSSKYKALNDQVGLDEATMGRQNMMAIMALSQYASRGGKIIVLYPEGGRGDGALLTGDPKTAKLVEILAQVSGGRLLVLPTYVQGATSILPVHRGPDEFNIFLDYVQAGSGTITVGEPLSWSQMQPSCDELTSYCATTGTNASVGGKQLLFSRMMYSIAALAPTVEARGPWHGNSKEGLLCLANARN